MVKCGSRLVHTSQKSFSISSDNTDKPFTFSRVPHRSLNHSLTLIPAPIKPELDTPLITPHPWVCSWNTSRQGAWDGITDTRPSPRLFYHMWSTERTWTVTPQHNPKCFYCFPTGLCFYLMQLFKFLFFRSHTVKTVNQKNKIQLSFVSYQVLYYTKYFHMFQWFLFWQCWGLTTRNSATVGLEQLHR